MRYQYSLVNTNGMTERQIEDAEHALEICAFVCQQEFEKALDTYHEINIVAEASGEAFVSAIEIDNDEVFVTLDCRNVTA
jgi:hypothetical protein